MISLCLKKAFGPVSAGTFCYEKTSVSSNLNLTRINFGLESLDFGILGDCSLLHFAGNLGLGEFDGIALVLLGQFKSLMQLLLERAVANLLQDICVPRLVDFECFVAVGQMISCMSVLPVFVSCGAIGHLRLANRVWPLF